MLKLRKLNKKEEQMNDKWSNLSSAIEELNHTRSALDDNSVSVAQQIKIYQEIVNSYVAAGCKPNDVIAIKESDKEIGMDKKYLNNIKFKQQFNFVLTFN